MYPDFDAVFPPGARLGTVALFFLIAMVAMHFVLIWWWKLGKVGWKIVDYVWLMFAALGILTTVERVRIDSATESLGIFYARAANAYDIAMNLVRESAERPGPVCRTFVRGEGSPPPEEFQRIQRDYDADCAWFKAVQSSLQPKLPAPGAALAPLMLPESPRGTNEALQQIHGDVRQTFDWFNQRVRAYNDVREATRVNEVEGAFGYSAPFLLSLAIALRATKVTAELREVWKR